MDVGERIGKRITSLMRERGNMSNAALARTLADLREGSTVEGWRSQIIAWKKGRIPDAQNAELLAEALGVDASEFRPAEETQAVVETLRARSEFLEGRTAEQEARLAELERQIATRSADERQPRELAKPGSRTRRTGSG